MSRIDRYDIQVVESFPSPLDSGTLYVSLKYSTAGHLCPCGCAGVVVTKLSPARYTVSFDGEVSLSPSVAASGLRCNSHYFISRGRVDWRRPLDRRQVARGYAIDRNALRQQQDSDGASWSSRLLRFIGR